MSKSPDNWIDAEEVYRELAIPAFHMPFKTWFSLRISGEYPVDEDDEESVAHRKWKVEEKDGKLSFWVDRDVAEDAAAAEVGPDATRLRVRSMESGKYAETFPGGRQEYAITGDED